MGDPEKKRLTLGLSAFYFFVKSVPLWALGSLAAMVVVGYLPRDTFGDGPEADAARNTALFAQWTVTAVLSIATIPARFVEPGTRNDPTWVFIPGLPIIKAGILLVFVFLSVLSFIIGVRPEGVMILLIFVAGLFPTTLEGWFDDRDPRKFGSAILWLATITCLLLAHR